MENNQQIYFKRSEDIKDLAKALAGFQKKVEMVKKDGSNPHFKSKYATLDAIIEAVKTPLSESGLAFTQLPANSNKLVTILMHESGQFLECWSQLSGVNATAQQYGSALTYMRRYALSSILGIATDEDDDGNSASDPKNANKAPNKTQPPVKTPPQKPDAKSIITNLAQQVGIEKNIAMRENIEAVTGLMLEPVNYTRIITKLEEIIKEKKK